MGPRSMQAMIKTRLERNQLVSSRAEAWRPPRFKPIKTRRTDRFAAAARRFVDLQAGSIWSDLRGLLPSSRGCVRRCRLLRPSPYRSLVHPDAIYQAIDTVDAERHFGYRLPDTTYYEGTRRSRSPMLSVDVVLCTETLEHVPEPLGLHPGRGARCLKPGGRMFSSIPFAARWHFIPHDYWRLTPSGLDRLLSTAGFTRTRPRARKFVDRRLLQGDGPDHSSLLAPGGKLGVRLLMQAASLPMLPVLFLPGLDREPFPLATQGGDDCPGLTRQSRLAPANPRSKRSPGAKRSAMQSIGDQEPLSDALLRIAAIVLGVTIGMQEMMAAFVLVPKPVTENTCAQLSDVGRGIYCPERDMPIFLLGCVSSLVLALGICKTWEVRLRDKKGSEPEAEIRYRLAWLLLLALGSTLTSFLVLTPSWMRSISGKPKAYQIALLVLPGLATLVVGVVGVRPGRLSRWVADIVKWVTRANVNPPALDTRPFQRSGRFFDLVWGLMIVVLIVLLAYVPSYRELAGRVFERDSFHHWDFFVVVARRAPEYKALAGHSQRRDIFPVRCRLPSACELDRR